MKGKKRNGKGPRTRIRTRMMITYLIPLSLFVGAFGTFFFHLAKGSLDTEFGKRLIAIGRSALVQIPTDLVLGLSEGDEHSRLYRNVRRKLENLRRINGVKRIYLFDLEMRALVDTEAGILIGTRYVKDFDREELERVRRGESAASILFKGTDGRYYKTGYAPVRDAEGRVGGFIGVDASVEFFQTLRHMRRNVVTGVFIAVGIIVLTSIYFAHSIETPIRKLVAAARRIEVGDLETPIPVERDDEFGFLSHSMDEMRKGILKRDQALKMMLSGIAHEVRNPLGGMSLFTGILAEALAGDTEKLGYIQKIEKELRNLERIVATFLDYARPLQVRRSRIDLDAFFQEVFTILAPEMERISVSWHFGDPDGLSFDPALMRQVFLNLVRNAIQAMPKGGELEITGTLKGRIYRIEVIDSGTGIAGLAPEDLFNPFFTTKQKGSGLGLAFVKRIIEAHGGTVSIADRPDPRRGTVVTIELPLVSAEAEGEKKRAANPRG
ncbi:MAG: HAMP domain-containing protein [Deltaproteobacteria bacterium]|nr:MAG: HAMP domain-containing protein [Deltaproteobacteria bacterium]